VLETLPPSMVCSGAAVLEGTFLFLFLALYLTRVCRVLIIADGLFFFPISWEV